MKTLSSPPQYETLRVFPVVLPIGRVVASTPQRINLSPKPTASAASAPVHILPPSCGLIINNTGLHYNPKYWPSPHLLAPSRWLHPTPNMWVPPSPPIPSQPPPDQHEPFTPRHIRGTFLTFSEGPRACLGKRFAQAEFVAFFAHVLRGHRIRLGAGVRAEEVDRLLRLRSAGSPITLAPAGDVRLKLMKR